METAIPTILISCAEAARYLGVSRATISARIRRRLLTKRTIGGVTGILLEELIDAKNSPRGDGTAMIVRT